MPTNYSSRVMVSLGALLIALFLIFGIPSSKLWDSRLTFILRTNLRPGIDMVGGVRLIYAIQPGEGGGNRRYGPKDHGGPQTPRRSQRPAQPGLASAGRNPP